MSKKGYKTSSLLSIQDLKVDNQNRMVEGYFSAFNVIDSEIDRIQKGTFTKSIKENGP